ncbi:MAG: flavodoxin-dependent (E)-4-hydroxy-3-methylbut-2-enyl-diphosphate synthase [Bacilli bacterium]|nr:flavodoxin-dependent (E)-4-hydroxy-3-methylbut-2-enyl-diphosphate synthase [Bacilli bacterium]
MIREHTKQIKVGNIIIGGQNKVVIQSMCNIKTEKVDEVVKQILEMEEEGLELIRVSVLDFKDAEAIKEIKKRIHIPLVCDIHYDYRLALKAIESGADKIRLNPGNLKNEDQINQIIDCCKKYNVPIRIGVNSGSVDPELVKQNNNKVDVDLMLKSLDRYIEIFEKHNFYNLVLALKSSNPLTTLEAYRKASKRYSYPLHIGVTETSYKDIGLIRSCVGLVPLLLEGIGDTIRISLSDEPIEEVRACKRLLHELNLYPNYYTLISCPMCGRANANIMELSRKVDSYLQKKNYHITVAIMGCVVNGVGEGKNADIGFAFNNSTTCSVFVKGKIIGTCHPSEVISYLEKYLDEFKL